MLEAFKKNLKINVGETTADRMFSLEVGRCFGACGLAPVAMIKAIRAVVHDNEAPARAFDLYRMLKDQK